MDYGKTEFNHGLQSQLPKHLLMSTITKLCDSHVLHNGRVDRFMGNQEWIETCTGGVLRVAYWVAHAFAPRCATMKSNQSVSYHRLNEYASSTGCCCRELVEYVSWISMGQNRYAAFVYEQADR
jgi:hypothetical protein